MAVVLTSARCVVLVTLRSLHLLQVITRVISRAGLPQELVIRLDENVSSIRLTALSSAWIKVTYLLHKSERVHILIGWVWKMRITVSMPSGLLPACVLLACTPGVKRKRKRFAACSHVVHMHQMHLEHQVCMQRLAISSPCMPATSRLTDAGCACVWGLQF